MSSHRLFVVFSLLVAGCATRRLEALPPERDPAHPDAPVSTYAPLPDVLRGELYVPGSDADAGHGHHHHGDHASPGEPPPAAETPATPAEPAAEPSTPADSTSDEDGASR